MAATETKTSIFARLDQLNEYERHPVGEDKLQPGSYFAGSFAGEHVAATEFVIGALFVQVGAGALDILVGLLLGNLLAVLSWTCVCAPIAVNTRLTLYWYLRRIAGPGVTVIYNVLNAALYCILAGCMITVSASAVRIAFGVEAQTGWIPTDPYFVLVVIGVGAVVVTLAILGFKRLAQFATVCSPWMFLMFVAGALVMLPTLAAESGLEGIRDFSDFWKVANEQIWTGTVAESGQPSAEGPAGSPIAADAESTQPDGAAGPADADPTQPEQSKPDPWGLWHVVFFAWVCNLAMHLGMSDMALFRYARRATYGLYSALGMYLGHYLAWVCAGIMGAAVAAMMQTPLGDLDAGDVAFRALGVAGALAVVIAGWTTSNPTLYRAGLALQVVTPGWPRWLVTLLAGIATTAIACFPFVFRGLLDFVVLYGILLVPIGVIVVIEHWVFPRIGFNQCWCSRKGLTWSWPAIISWGVPLLLALVCWYFEILHQNFLLIPVWLLTAGIYIALSARAGARDALPEVQQQEAAPAPPPAPQQADPPPKAPFDPKLFYLSGALAVGALAACLLLSFCVFTGRMSPEQLKIHLIWITFVYFQNATIWMVQRGKRKSASGG